MSFYLSVCMWKSYFANRSTYQLGMCIRWGVGKCSVKYGLVWTCNTFNMNTNVINRWPALCSRQWEWCSVLMKMRERVKYLIISITDNSKYSVVQTVCHLLGMRQTFSQTPIWWSAGVKMPPTYTETWAPSLLLVFIPIVRRSSRIMPSCVEEVVCLCGPQQVSPVKPRAQFCKSVHCPENKLTYVSIDCKWQSSDIIN